MSDRADGWQKGRIGKPGTCHALPRRQEQREGKEPRGALEDCADGVHSAGGEASVTCRRTASQTALRMAV
jgi:hypothetical protein